MSRGPSRKPRRWEVGMATGTVIIVAGILSSMAAAILQYSRTSQYDTGFDNVAFFTAVKIAKANLYAVGQNPDSLANTVNGNSATMGCIDFTTPNTGEVISGGATNCAVSPKVFNSYDAANSLYYYGGGTINGITDTTSPDGFDWAGEPCVYTAGGTQGCIFRLHTFWMPFCGGSQCQVGPNRIVFYFNLMVPSNSDISLNSAYTNEGVFPLGNPYR